MTTPRPHNGGTRRKQVLFDVEIDTLDPRVISTEHGWWFPERGPGNFGELESAANVLTSAGPPYDPAFGSYQLRGLLCEVEKE